MFLNQSLANTRGNVQDDDAKKIRGNNELQHSPMDASNFLKSKESKVVEQLIVKERQPVAQFERGLTGALLASSIEDNDKTDNDLDGFSLALDKSEAQLISVVSNQNFNDKWGDIARASSPINTHGYYYGTGRESPSPRYINNHYYNNALTASGNPSVAKKAIRDAIITGLVLGTALGVAGAIFGSMMFGAGGATGGVMGIVIGIGIGILVGLSGGAGIGLGTGAISYLIRHSLATSGSTPQIQTDQTSLLPKQQPDYRRDDSAANNRRFLSEERWRKSAATASYGDISLYVPRP